MTKPLLETIAATSVNVNLVNLTNFEVTKLATDANLCSSFTFALEKTASLFNQTAQVFLQQKSEI